MSQVTDDYFCVITKAGEALEAAAHQAKVPVKLKWLAVGDGDGEVPVPDRKFTGLAHEVYRRKIDGSRIDADDPNVWWIHAVIPADVGGFWIREFGIFAESLEPDGEPVLYGYGNHAPYYKSAKVLGQATSHQLEIPVIMSGSANLQIAVKDAGYASQSALNNLSATIGQMMIIDQEYRERLRQLELDNIIATLAKLGKMKPDGWTIGIKQDGTIFVRQGNIFSLGEIYCFLNPTLKPGMVPAWGTLIEQADERYPEMWDFLQTEEGQEMCVTEEEWQAMNNAIFYTAADGTQFGWNGQGGAPAYVIDIEAKTIRVCDVRGMFPEPIGGPASPGLGKAGGDGIRDFFARLVVHANFFNMEKGIHSNNGAVEVPSNEASTFSIGNYLPHTYATSIVRIRPGIASPVARVNRVASYGVISCCYLGEPKITAG